jgi:hypothetical protein
VIGGGVVGHRRGREDVGVRGAELAENLPQQVGEVPRPGDPVQQRSAGVEDAVPVHPAEVGRPEVMAHVPAGLGVAVTPPGGGIGEEPGPGLVHRHPVRRVVRVRLAVGRYDAELAVI